MIVVPCYNEEEVLSSTIEALSDELDRLMEDELVSRRSCLLFVDDGSRDSTWQLLEQHARSNRLVTAVKLARNAGHQNALLCGLQRAGERGADCVISIDADLQDDIRVIRSFITLYRDGCDIVYGVREDRESDSWFKRTSAVGFYRVMARLGVKLEHNHADCRLLSRRALEHLKQFREVNLFLRGLIPLLGLPAARVYYSRKPRTAGTSKYPLGRMLSLAFEGVTSFTAKPIRFVTGAGFVLFVCSLLAGLYTVISKWSGTAVSGWTSLMLSLWFIGGVQLLAVGLIGEYVGKIYSEVKQRPRYLIEKELDTASEMPLSVPASRLTDAGIS
ncbi:glycosyltransferase family 2 protein [Paenibacillus chartarius]|uniref:Glycosyltransferase family 2 protein n=1 Tax=Paenibacillus chartarius TaxID=747481 RepID=A0ABV6DPC8_9BACL